MDIYHVYFGKFVYGLNIDGIGMAKWLAFLPLMQ